MPSRELREGAKHLEHDGRGSPWCPEINSLALGWGTEKNQQSSSSVEFPGMAKPQAGQSCHRNQPCGQMHDLEPVEGR